MKNIARKIPFGALGALFILGLVVAPSALADENPAPADASLLPVYKEFGEKPGLVALMDDLMIELVNDPRTRPFFADVDQKHVKAELVDQFCVILGGPCVYTGKGMQEVHAKLAITEGSFNALVEDLQVAMNKHDIPFRSQNKLLQKLAPMHREVINRQ
ncbi:MAG: group 1 truncated hemoglobin [Rudaea sp.]